MIPFWYSAPAILAILAGGSLFFSGETRRFHRYMGFTFIFDGLLLMLSGIMHAKLSSFYFPIYGLYTAMMLMCPLFYYYAVRCVSCEKGLQERDGLLMAVPAAVLIVVSFVCSSIPALEKNLFFALTYCNFPRPGHVSTGTSAMLGLDKAVYIIALIENIGIQLFCFISLKNYGKLLERYYSDTEGKSLGLLTAVFCLIALRLIVMIVLGFAPGLLSELWFRVLQATALSMFYLALAYFIFKIRFTAEELSKSISTQEHKIQAPMADELISARMAELLKEKFFTDPSVSLMDLAAKVQINTKYLSDYLHFHYGETFLSFTNRLRIEYAITLMEAGKLQLSDVAEKAGFTTPSTFYRNFTRITGVSPSEFKKKQ